MTKIIMKKFFEEITFLGGIAFYLFVIILFIISQEYVLSLRLFLALIIIYFMAFVIRLFYFKDRPEKVTYTNFLERIDASSFPSIHAARLTYLFLFILFSSPFFIQPIVKIIIGAVFLLAVYSRIYLSKHDIVDVLAGVILGGFAIITFFLPL
jgi:membrane-associated phospholipid phosphatase